MQKKKSLALAIMLALTASPFTVEAAPNGEVATAQEDTDTAETTTVAAKADNAKQTADYQTKAVTVTASGWEELAKDAPASVTVVTKDEIAKRGYTDLRQVLDTIEGVDTMGSTGRFDTPNISIRGLDDSYTLIMVDGVAQTGPGIAGGMMRSFNQLANTSLPSPSQIERIEVVRGPMSTLYGSDAMGGVINIITKKITKEFSGNLSVGNLFETDHDKKNMQKYSFNVSGPITRDKVGIQLRGSYLNRGESVYGIEHEPRDLRNWNLGTRVQWTPSAGNEYYFDFDRGQNMRSGSFAQSMSMTVNPFAGIDDSMLSTITAHPTGDNFDQRFDRTKAVLSAKNDIGKGTWTNTLSFLRNEMHLGVDVSDNNPSIDNLFMKMMLSNFGGVQMNANIRNHVKNDFITFDSNYVTPIGLNHMLTVGGRWQQEKVDYHLQRNLSPTTGMGFTPSMLSNMAASKSSNDSDNLKRHTWSLFAEDEWNLTPKLDFTYGVRYDHPSDFDDNYSPRGYLVYKADKYITVKGGVATGYKAPSLVQSNPIDLNLNITGETYRGNANLKPEKSTTEEIGFYYSNDHKTNAHLTFFNTDFHNKIDLSDAVNNIRTYENIGKARVHGIELGTSFPVMPKVMASANWTLLTSRIKSGEDEGLPLRSTPKQAVNLKLDWLPTESTDIWINAMYRNGMRRTTQAEGLSTTYRPFTLVNMGATQKLKGGLSVQFAINNLFNRDFKRTTTDANGNRYGVYYDDLDADGVAGGSYFSGRSYWLGLSYNF